MPKIRKLWRVSSANIPLATELSGKLGVSSSITQVLINRGITTEKSANEFLFGSQDKLGNPYLLKDMEIAVKRICLAIDTKQKITVYGDYDVDGMTASALMVKVITDLGGVIDYYIPDRQTEGYGLNPVALDLLSTAGTQLLITVDCGISGMLEVDHFKGQMDIIITDHHQPPEILPQAYAIINPKQKDCLYPNKDLAGVGVAYKLCQALWQHYGGAEAALLQYMDIVAIGTVADIVALTGENRILVKLGLKQLSNTNTIGLESLMEVCGIDKGQINTGKIGFGIAPRLNAAGRISSATLGVELLITQDKERACQLATLLNDENVQRQAIEKDIQTAAEHVLASVDINEAKVLVVVGENWHSGVIGIVASRLVEKYYRPIIMISIQDGIGKASCRSIPAFDLYAALEQCSDLLIKFGGHHQAAGLSILPQHIEELRVRLSEIAARCLAAEDLIPVLKIDTIVTLESMNADFLEQLKCLEPYGMGNASPIFACEGLGLQDVRTLGKEAQHLKLKVNQGNGSKDVVAWRMGELANGLQGDREVDVAFFPETNEWQGRSTIQLRAYDIRQMEKTELEGLYIRYNKSFDLQNSHEDCFVSIGKELDTQLEDHHLATIQDARGTDDKRAYLLPILQEQGKVMIIVNTGREAYDLAQHMRICLPELKDQIGFYYAGLQQEWQTKMMTWFQQETLKVLMTTTIDWETCDLPEIQHVVLYSLPFNQQSFIQRCRLAGRGGQSSIIHVLFNQRDIEANHLLLKEVGPERIVVGYVYLVLKKAQGVMNEAGIAAQVWKNYHITLSRCSIDMAIRILAELGLLERKMVGLQTIIEMLPTPQDKLDIECSMTFRQGMIEKAEFIEFATNIMDISIKRLVSPSKV